MSNQKTFRLLQASCILTLLGWGILHFIASPPYRIIFWNEPLLKPIIQGLFGFSWSDYVRSQSVDKFISNFTIFIGVIFCFTTLASFILREKILKYLLPLSSTLLAFLFFCGFLNKGMQLPYFIEHSIQIIIPYIFLLAIQNRKFVVLAKICIALTFIGHGLYALGIYPRPGGFIDMMINILNISEKNSIFFLIQFGLIDIVVAIFIFVKPYQKYALLYCFIWGILTALARVWSFHADFWQWLPETGIRFVHGLLPLALFFKKED